MMDTATAAAAYSTANYPTTLIATRGRDKYGRTSVDFAIGTRTIGRAVLLPKAARRPGQVWLSNDWTVTGDASVQYHASRADANARMEHVAEALGAARVYYR